MPLGHNKGTELPTLRERLLAMGPGYGPSSPERIIRTEAAAMLQTAAEALGEIAQWAEAYPADMFAEPDFAAVNKALTDAGIPEQMDRLHASWARHLITGVGNIARAALERLNQ